MFLTIFSFIPLQAKITLNRPQALNALNMDMLQRLLGLLDQAQANDSVNALVITGTGDIAFSAGADIKFLNQATPVAVRSFAQMAIAVNHKIETLGKVVIAAIHGYCFGGGLEMAEAYMIRVAARPAKLDILRCASAPSQGLVARPGLLV